jgi:tetratricopeptide (TPR) repeat protein
MQSLYEEAMRFLQSANEFSPGSCNSKVYLLQAEMFSFKKKNQQAKEKYTDSISSSRYVHEKGLACEQAGSHHQKISDASEALKYFEQAKECYKEWGSQMKMEAMDKAMSRLSGSAKV